MKKVLLLVFMFVTAFAVVSCNGTTTESTESTVVDTEAPVITGANDVTIFLDSTFDPMDGVTATDNVDGDITDRVIVTGTVDTTKEGVNFLKYSVTDDAGNKREVNRYVTVEIDMSTVEDGMPQNGDFSLGAAIWTVAENEGGAGTFSVVDEVGKLTIDAAGWSVPFPRLDSSVMEFENGETYEVTFRAKADAARSIKVQVGQLLPENPWFVDYLNARIVIFDLGTDWEEFSFKFTMNEDEEVGTMLEGQLLFNHGTIEGGVGTSNLNTVVYYDDVLITESTPDEDLVEPTISGAVDLTLETGATFNPLAGVTAIDDVDGSITLDETNYVSDVDTSTPGEYTVTYTVSDKAGNEAEVVITVTVVDLLFVDTEEVIDGTFTETTEIIAEVQDENNGYADITDPEIWYHYLATHESAAATISVVGGAAVLDITAPGGADWGVQLKQRGIALEQGKTYSLTFTASSTEARDMVAKVANDYFVTLDLTTEAEVYSLVFTYEGTDTTDAVMTFLLGNTESYAASTVTIDDVELGVLEQEELVLNGEFDTIPWNTYVHGDAGAESTMEIVDGELVMNVTNVGTDFWNIQLFQEGITLVPDTEYTITFDAKSSVARDINLVLIAGTEFRKAFDLTDEMDTYTYTFTYDGTLTTGKIDFELGDISEDSVPAVVTFDNITMTDGTNPVAIEFSNFDGVYGWDTYVHGDAGAQSTMEVVDDQLVVDVTNQGTAFWNVQIFQEGIKLIPGETYSVVFNASSSVARDMNFVLIDSNNAEFRKAFDLTDEMATYIYTFTYDGTANTGKLDFELGNISEDSVPAIVTFENVMFFRNFNPQPEPVVPTEESWAVYGTMTLVETETEKTVTYVSGDTNAWDSNLQGLILPFDGTETHIVFTFTGVADHLYLFKIEVNQDLGRQIEVTATGSQQEVVLDLSTMSETERDQLNKIIIFSWDTTQEGTFVLHGWDYYTPAE